MTDNKSNTEEEREGLVEDELGLDSDGVDAGEPAPLPCTILGTTLVMVLCVVVKVRVLLARGISWIMKRSTSTSSPKDKKALTDNHLECPICMKVYIRATDLNYGHTFCLDCIMDWAKKWKQDKGNGRKK